MEKKLQFQSIDIDALALSILSKKIEDLQKIIEINDFCNLNEDLEIFIRRTQNMVGKFKLDTLKFVFIDDLLV